MEDIELLVLDEDDMIEFIFEKLVSEGIAVDRKDIGKILTYELAYMVMKGFVEDEEPAE